LYPCASTSFSSAVRVGWAADYKRNNDVERFEAAESYCKDLQRIMLLYEGSRLRPPTPKQLKEIPYGDVRNWLETHEHAGDFKEW
jgi:hypothetical protein